MSTCTLAAAKVGVRFGTAEDGQQIVTADDDALAGSGTSVAAGKGTSTDSILKTVLGGAALLAFAETDGSGNFFSSAAEVHGSVKAHTGAGFSGGTIGFIVDFIVLEQNTK